MVLPVYGMVSHRANMLSEFSGGTSTQKLTGHFRDAMNDPNVGTIVLDVDSPGGTIDGVPELAAEIFASRGKKRTIGVANTLSASASYWLTAMAEEVVASPSAMLGSIGVYTMHSDVSKMNENLGVKPTVISAGKYKAETHPYAPLSSEASEYLQEQVDFAYSMFVADVARGRSASKKEVTDGFGQGRVVPAAQAVKIGLADRVATLDQVLNKLGVGSQRKATNVALEQRRLETYGALPQEEEV
jgi:signal peptide peptidase SppA